MQQEYDIIKRSRAMLEASRTVAPGQRTIDGYKTKVRRLVRLVRDDGGLGIDALIAHAKHTKSASTWFSRKAALAYYFREALEKSLADQDKAQRALKAAGVPADAPEWGSWRKVVRQAGIWADWLARLKSEPGPPIAERKPRHSKRKDMKGLPADWRERMVHRSHKYRHAVLVQAVTGCRPAELVTGVKLTIEGESLVAVIDGAKVTGSSGQPWRRLSWDIASDSHLVRQLVMAVGDGLSLAKIEDAKAYSGAIRAAAGREWPRRRSTVTPYCFRHAAASDMKAAGIGDLEISAALGHCADVAKQFYGQWQMGSARGGVAPRSVEASRPVRKSKPAPMVQRDLPQSGPSM